MTDIENQANQKQNTIYPTGAPTDAQNIDTVQGKKKANKSCLGKPTIIAIVVAVVLLAILTLQVIILLLC